jgi:hypothetical protein
MTGPSMPIYVGQFVRYLIKLGFDQLLELVAVCDEVADKIEDRMTAG